MDAMKMKYLVVEPQSRTQIGIYSASTNGEAVALCLADETVRPVLVPLARQELHRRIQDQRRRARHSDRSWTEREIKRLYQEAEADPLPVLAGALVALDVPGLVRVYRSHIVAEAESRMWRLVETTRDAKAGCDRFESDDLYFAGYRFRVTCTRYENQRIADADLDIELIMPPRDDAQEPPGGLGAARDGQGNGKAPRTA